MNINEWSLVIGIVMSFVFSLGPWMFMVHAKLAVIASQTIDLCEKLEKASETNERLWVLYARHEARLDTHEVRISYISDRLDEVCSKHTEGKGI